MKIFAAAGFKASFRIGKRAAAFMQSLGWC